MGKPGCLPEIKAPVKAVLSLQKKVDLSDNAIDPTSALDSTYFDGFFKAEDPLNRYYIIEDIKNFTQEQGDDNVDEADDGSKEVVSKGIVSTTVKVKNIGDPYKHQGQLESMACHKIQVHFIDEDGNLVGEKTSADFLGGRKIAQNTLSAKVIAYSSTETNGLEISWDYDRASSNSKVDYIAAETMTDTLLDRTPLSD